MAWLEYDERVEILTREDVRRRTKVFVGTTSVGSVEDVVTTEKYFPALTEKAARQLLDTLKNKDDTTAVMSRQNDCGAFRVDVSTRTVTDVQTATS